MTVIRQNKIDILVGMIAPFGMSSVPTGWLACDGSAISRTTYADLFTAIGTTWGAGDGSSTFALPDLEGAFLRGTGSHATSNMADGNDFAGPSVGAFENDSFQGHFHNVQFKDDNDYFIKSGVLTHSGSTQRYHEGAEASSSLRAKASVTDGTNGTPRAGDETRPFNAGVKYCIKY